MFDEHLDDSEDDTNEVELLLPRRETKQQAELRRSNARKRSRVAPTKCARHTEPSRVSSCWKVVGASAKCRHDGPSEHVALVLVSSLGHLATEFFWARRRSEV